MAIYHCTIKIGSKGNGQNAISAAAYRSGTSLQDYQTNEVKDFTRKGGVVYSEIMLCDNAPNEYCNREVLWNSVNDIEKSATAQVYREIEVALPQELDRDTQISIVREYVKSNFVDKGMCADFSIHDKKDGNPHCHIMLTMRAIDDYGKWLPKSKNEYKLDDNGERIPIIDKKTGIQKVDKQNRKQWERIKIDTVDWNSQGKAEEWRASWAEECNKYLTEDNRIDHRSFERQGLDQIPTIHEGYIARQIERNGGVSERCEVNREIRKHNSLIVQIANRMKEIAEKIKMIKAEIEEEFKQKGAMIADGRIRLQQLLSRRDKSDIGTYGKNAVGEGAAGTDDREYEAASVTVGTGENSPSDTDRAIAAAEQQIAQLEYEQEQQRIADEQQRAADEAEQQRKIEREIEEAERREREQAAAHYKNSGAR